MQKKNVTWCILPWSSTLKTNIGKEILKLLDTSFPPSKPLHKLFTRRTVKIGYRCMPNMQTLVARHNQKMLKNGSEQIEEGCNCKRGVANCPFQGKCQTKNLVYEATVTETVSGKTETYTGLTSRPMKTRIGEHNTSMNNPAYRTRSSLSTHAWNLKEQGIDFSVKWRKLEKAKPFNPVTKKCRLCLKEKFYIMYRRQNASLNRRNEVFNTCRHRNKTLLSVIK